MASGTSNQLIKQVGEYRVAAELARRGLFASTFSGNIPYYDIVASHPQGGHVPVQVKSKARGSWQLNIGHYAEVTFDGEIQHIGKAQPPPTRGLVYVFVDMGLDCEDQFYVIDWDSLCILLIEAHRAYLAKHGGRRPKNPTSVHTAVGAKQLAAYRDRWEIITDSITA